MQAMAMSRVSRARRGNYFLVLLACFAMAQQNVGQERNEKQQQHEKSAFLKQKEMRFSSSDNNLPAARCI